VYKLKRYPDGRPRKFKARLCVRGDKQVEGIDYTDKSAALTLCCILNVIGETRLQTTATRYPLMHPHSTRYSNWSREGEENIGNKGKMQE